MQSRYIYCIWIEPVYQSISMLRLSHGQCCLWSSGLSQPWPLRVARSCSPLTVGEVCSRCGGLLSILVHQASGEGAAISQTAQQHTKTQENLHTQLQNSASFFMDFLGSIIYLPAKIMLKQCVNEKKPCVGHCQGQWERRECEVSPGKNGKWPVSQLVTEHLAKVLTEAEAEAVLVCPVTKCRGPKRLWDRKNTRFLFHIFHYESIQDWLNWIKLHFQIECVWPCVLPFPTLFP